MFGILAAAGSGHRGFDNRYPPGGVLLVVDTFPLRGARTLARATETKKQGGAGEDALGAVHR